MHRIEGENVDTTEGKNLFKSEAPYTTQTPDWTNAVQEEIMNIIDEAGLETLFSDNDTRDQLLTALNKLYNVGLITVNDSDYTANDFVGNNTFIFTNLTADRNFNLPTLADNYLRVIYVINLDGSYDVICNPEGTENINDWNYQFNITEKYGILKFIGLSDRWLCIPINDACIYSVESETADTGLALDGTWDDVAGMTLLNGIYGYGYLSARGTQNGRDSSDPEYIYLYWGLGKTSGNNAPDIPGGDDYTSYVRTTANNLDTIASPRKIVDCPYESDGSVVYMKSKVISDELNITHHRMYGETNSPMGLYWRRIY